MLLIHSAVINTLKGIILGQFKVFHRLVPSLLTAWLVLNFLTELAGGFGLCGASSGDEIQHQLTDIKSRPGKRRAVFLLHPIC